MKVLIIKLRARIAAAFLIVGVCLVALANWINPTDVLGQFVEDLFASLELADARLDARIEELAAGARHV